jgi:hypothetical protein
VIIAAQMATDDGGLFFFFEALMGIKIREEKA